MTKQVLIMVMIFTAIFVVITFMTIILLAFVVKKDVEKRLNNKIEFPIYLTIPPWGFWGKYTCMAGLISVIFFIEKKVLKKRAYYKNNFLAKINYSSKNESKTNIIICFTHIIALFLSCFFASLIVYIGSQIYKI
ncbi:MAG: hypothetical protein V4591_02225 [Bdellovibrionota bacterium]